MNALVVWALIHSSNALRRFIARRGNIRILPCDNGLNFVRALRELAKTFLEM